MAIATKKRQSKKKQERRPGTAQPQGEWYELYEHKFDILRGHLFNIAKNKSPKKDWTPALLSVWTGVGEGTIRDIASGETRFPRLSTMIRLGNGLGLELCWTKKGKK